MTCSNVINVKDLMKKLQTLRSSNFFELFSLLFCYILFIDAHINGPAASVNYDNALSFLF